MDTKEQEAILKEIEINTHIQEIKLKEIEKNTRTTKNCMILISGLIIIKIIIKLLIILIIAYYITGNTFIK